MTRYSDTRSGQLHQRIEFQRRVYVSDGYGNEQGDFVAEFECRAGFNNLRGSETVIASRLTGVQPMKVRVRSTSNTRMVGTDWRIRDVNSGKFYAITAVVQDFDDTRWMDIMVTEGVAE